MAAVLLVLVAMIARIGIGIGIGIGKTVAFIDLIHSIGRSARAQIDGHQAKTTFTQIAKMVMKDALTENLQSVSRKRWTYQVAHALPKPVAIYGDTILAPFDDWTISMPRKQSALFRYPSPEEAIFRPFSDHKRHRHSPAASR